MQSGLKKFDKWVIEFITEDPGKNPLMLRLKKEFKRTISRLNEMQTNDWIN